MRPFLLAAFALFTLAAAAEAAAPGHGLRFSTATPASAAPSVTAAQVPADR